MKSKEKNKNILINKYKIVYLFAILFIELFSLIFFIDSTLNRNISYEIYISNILIIFTSYIILSLCLKNKINKLSILTTLVSILFIVLKPLLILYFINIIINFICIYRYTICKIKNKAVKQFCKITSYTIHVIMGLCLMLAITFQINLHYSQLDGYQYTLSKSISSPTNQYVLNVYEKQNQNNNTKISYTIINEEEQINFVIGSFTIEKTVNVNTENNEEVKWISNNVIQFGNKEYHIS